MGCARSTHRYEPQTSDETERLVQRILELAARHPRYGYRRIAALLRREGWRIHRKHIHRIWRQEGLKVTVKQRKRRRLGASQSACYRQRAASPNQVWSYDFVMDQTEEGRRLKILPVVDEFTRECLTIEVERHFTAQDVTRTLSRLFSERGCLQFIRSDNVLPTKSKSAARPQFSGAG